jgi:ketopantoate reductase
VNQPLPKRKPMLVVGCGAIGKIFAAALARYDAHAQRGSG